MNILTKNSTVLTALISFKWTKAIIIAFAFHALPSIAQERTNIQFTSSEKPKLVVNLVVGGVRYDQLYRFRERLSEGGFKRLVSGGTTFTNARSSFMYTSPECGGATLASGANPSGHGVVGKKWVNYTTNEKIELFKNEKYKGIGCNEDEGQFSPENLTASTLADELKNIDSNSKVYSIALEHSEAIIHGGYKADGCYWFDSRYGHFVTSSYYQSQLPIWVSNFNESDRKWSYLNKLWNVEYDYENYTYQNATAILRSKGSTLSFNKIFKPKNKSFKHLLESPTGNNYLKDFAIEAIRNDSLGLDNSTDLLTINFSSQREIARIYGSASTENEDSYYKLDKDISEIVDYLNQYVGEDNYLLVLTSTHGVGDVVERSEAANQGKFNAMQFKVLISGFMNAQFGTNNWVTEYSNRQLYINRRLAYEKNISIEEIQNKISSIALQFSGVANAVTATTLQTSSFNRGVLSKMQNSFFPRNSGDVMINLLPGWIEIESEDDIITKSSWGSPYEYDTHIPLIFFGKNIDNKIIDRDVDLMDVAPTICDMIGIAHPNATEGKSINEIF
ncbi:MAG: alkaline phosphatase family protein [Rikenellaceae bacterium]